jgi:hypothetical protein
LFEQDKPPRAASAGLQAVRDCRGFCAAWLMGQRQLSSPEAPQ